MSYLNHNLPTTTCYIRNEFLFNHKKGHGEVTLCDEISNDDVTPKKHDFVIQNELHSKIRNDQDYDDWEYGTEPIFG
jgi:hypothetical protein